MPIIRARFQSLSSSSFFFSSSSSLSSSHLIPSSTTQPAKTFFGEIKKQNDKKEKEKKKQRDKRAVIIQMHATFPSIHPFIRFAAILFAFVSKRQKVKCSKTPSLPCCKRVIKVRRLNELSPTWWRSDEELGHRGREKPRRERSPCPGHAGYQGQREKSTRRRSFRHRLQVGMRWESFERGNSRVQDVSRFVESSREESRVVPVGYLATGISSRQTVEKRGDMYTF